MKLNKKFIDRNILKFAVGRNSIEFDKNGNVIESTLKPNEENKLIELGYVTAGKKAKEE